MNFMDAVRKRKEHPVEVIPLDIPKRVSEPLTDHDIPAGMPLTHRLDKMTREQAVWAIQNGDAWLAHLSRCGVDTSNIEIASDTGSESPNIHSTGATSSRNGKEQQAEVYRLYNLGLSKAEIEQMTGICGHEIDTYLGECKF